MPAEADAAGSWTGHLLPVGDASHCPGAVALRSAPGAACRCLEAVAPEIGHVIAAACRCPEAVALRTGRVTGAVCRCPAAEGGWGPALGQPLG